MMAQFYANKVQVRAKTRKAEEFRRVASTAQVVAPLSVGQRVKSRVSPMLGFKSFFNARRVVAGVELVQKIVKDQFDVPTSFGTDPFCIWYNMLAA